MVVPLARLTLSWTSRSRYPCECRYHVDLGSKEYYAGVERLEECVQSDIL